MLLQSPPQTLGFDLRVKTWFRDTRSIIGDTWEDKQAKVLYRIGGGIRLTARRLQRKANKKGTPSAPGTPPRWHGGEFDSLKNIVYFIDPDGNTLAVGPVLLNHLHANADGTLVRGKVPAVEEFGGRVGIRERLVPFNLAFAYKHYGQAIGNQFRAAGYWMSESRVRKVYPDAQYRIDESAGGTWVPIGRHKRKQIVTRVRTARYPPRPFMGAALDKYLPRIPDDLKAAVRG